MRVLTLLIVVSLVLVAGTAEAQRNCKKGIPCGNSCISASKTCRIGTPDAAPAKKPLDSAQQAFLRRLRGEPDDYVLIETGPFLGSVDGNIYYRNDCLTGATKVLMDERVYFKSEDEAIAKGYRRSKAKNC